MVPTPPNCQHHVSPQASPVFSSSQSLMRNVIDCASQHGPIHRPAFGNLGAWPVYAMPSVSSIAGEGLNSMSLIASPYCANKEPRWLTHNTRQAPCTDTPVHFPPAALVGQSGPAAQPAPNRCTPCECGSQVVTFSAAALLRKHQVLFCGQPVSHDQTCTHIIFSPFYLQSECHLHSI